MSDDILSLPPPRPTSRERYGKATSQFGHLHLPSRHASVDSAERLPVVVAIHGGFWRAKYDLTHLDHFCAALARSGFAVWSLEYRRTGEAGGGWPGTFEDILAGIRYLQELSTRHPIDTGRVVLVGHSAGGQLALWATAELENPSPTSICGVVSLAGVADLEEAARLDLSNGAVRELLGGGPDDLPERYRLASAVRRLPLGIPQVIFHGTEDDCVPVEIARRHARQSQGAGDPMELRILEGLGHYELIDPRTEVFGEIARAVTGLAGIGGTDR